MQTDWKDLQHLPVIVGQARARPNRCHWQREMVQKMTVNEATKSQKPTEAVPYLCRLACSQCF